MNDQGLQTAQQNATNAAQSASNLSTAAPDLLNQLRQNLVGVFSNNNPIITARNNALSDYLSEGAKTRASLLPQNVGDVPGYAGRPLTFSPTEQDSMVTSRNAAALAPLTGYNAILQAMFGQIPDMVKNAGDIYGAHINAANDAAKIAEQNYHDSIDQYNAEKPTGGAGIFDDPGFQAMINGWNDKWNALMQQFQNANNRPSLDSFMGATPNTIPKVGGGAINVPKKVNIPAPKKTNPSSSGPTLNGYAGLNTLTGTGF